MKIFTYGCGAFGLALSTVLSDNGHKVFVYTRNEISKNEINEKHTLEKYLGNRQIGKNIIATNDFNELNDSDYLLICVPSKAYKDAINELNIYLKRKINIINATKGLESSTDSRISEFIFNNLNNDYILNFASILGPGFAKEIMEKKLTCVNAISNNLNYAQEIQKLFSNEYFRVYTASDLIGAEFASSIKNSIAIASGMLEGLGYEENTKAALVTRGLYEMAKISVEFGAKKDTFFGLCGLGDLMLTCNSDKSRNFSFGYKIGEKNSAKEIVENNTITIEGLYTTKVIYNLAKMHKIEMPIISTLYEILFNFKTPSIEIKQVMKRPLKEENFTF